MTGADGVVLVLLQSQETANLSVGLQNHSKWVISGLRLPESTPLMTEFCSESIISYATQS